MTALARWHELVENVNGRTVFGQAGVRDPDNPCEGFDPVPIHTGRGTCNTDGHYMCDECSERATCDGCGYRPNQCACPTCDRCGCLSRECSCETTEVPA